MNDPNPKAKYDKDSSRNERNPRVGGWLKGRCWEAENTWETDEELIDIMVNGPFFPKETETKR